MNKKPLVSYILLSYNQEAWIEAAVKSALKQDYDNIEFIFSDDNSKDRTFELIKNIACSSSRNIILNTNEKNMKLVPHFNKALSLCSGEIIVVAAGDDISFINRVSSTVKYLNENPDVSFLSFQDQRIKDNGKLLPNDEALSQDVKFTLDDFITNGGYPVSGASRAFRRVVYEKFGALSDSCPTEDTPYLLRCLYLGYGAVLSNPGIYYRVHDNSLSSSNGLKTMKLSSIDDQYLVDFNCAVQLGVINKAELAKLSSWFTYMTLFRKYKISNLTGKIYILCKLVFNLQFRCKIRNILKRKVMNILNT